MARLDTSFVGLKLQSPIIVGSSGLSKNADKAKAFADAGAGAIILKSLFEEQIELQTQDALRHNDYPEAIDYLQAYTKTEEVGKYLEHISRLKRELQIPIIASVNCMRSDSWVEFTEQIAQAGADAIEINIMRIETDLFFDPIASEQRDIQIVQQLRQRLSIPIIIKISRYHTAIPAFVDKLRAAGADAVTLFNRGYQPDINLVTETETSADVFTHQGDFTETLRFVAIVNGLIPKFPLSASTGIYGWEEVAKVLLAGASTAQMCTALYKGGVKALSQAVDGLSTWMDEHGYYSVDELIGRLNSQQTQSRGMYERMQFMKYFSEKS